MTHVIQEIQQLHEKILDLEAMREFMAVESLNGEPAVGPYAPLLAGHRARLVQLEEQFQAEMS